MWWLCSISRFCYFAGRFDAEPISFFWSAEWYARAVYEMSSLFVVVVYEMVRSLSEHRFPVFTGWPSVELCWFSDGRGLLLLRWFGVFSDSRFSLFDAVIFGYCW